MKEIAKSGLRRLGSGPTPGGGARTDLAPTVERSKLLYIEDVRDNWEVTDLMLRRRFDLRWAKNDEEACAVLASDAMGQISAVLMDIELQGSKLSGIDLTKLIRGTLKTDGLPEYAKRVPVMRDLPIIFVTGYSARYREDELIAYGGNRMLTKPVNFGDLSMALSTLAVEPRDAAAGPRAPAAEGTTRIAHLLADNPRFHVHLKALAEAGLFAPRGYAGDLGALTTMLGRTGIEAAAIAVSVLDMLRTRTDATGYLAALVFRRALACQLIAQRVAVSDVERATASGFLLDAGLLARAIHDPAGALEIGMAPASSRITRERAGNEIEHPQRILDVARNWNLPEDMIEAVRGHHEREPPAGNLGRIAWAAERIAAVFETGDIVGNNTAALAAGKMLNIMAKDVEGILDEIPERVRLLGETTGAHLPPQATYRSLLEQATPSLSLLARAYRELEQSSEAVIAEKAGLAERLSAASDSVAKAYKKDMALLAAVQSMFLPRESRFRGEQVELAAFYRAADDCGGDWWWHDETPERLRVFVGDVSGHGAGSAMVCGSVASAARVARQLSPTMDAVTLLHQLHRELYTMARGEYHMTMLIVEIPRQGGTVHLFSAAAPHVLCVHPDGKVVAAVTRGTPLGLPTDKFTVGRAELPAAPGTRVMCFTDGLYEFKTTQGQELGVKTLRKFLGDTRTAPIDEASKRIIDSVDGLHPNDVPQEDDMTLVLIDIHA